MQLVYNGMEDDNLKKIIFIMISVLLVTFASTCLAGSPDAAGKKELPSTIKSELERANKEGFTAKRIGSLAAFDLSIDTDAVKYPATPTGNVQSCDEQLLKLVYQNYKNKTNTEAYLGGLYAIFWENAVTQLKSDSIYSNLANGYFTEFRKKQKDLNIDDKTFFLFFFEENYYQNKILPNLNNWIKQLEK